MEKTEETTALETDDMEKKGTVVLLKTVLTPDKKSESAKTEKPPDSKPDVKTEPAKAEKPTAKPKAVRKSVKEEKPDSKSEKKPKVTKAVKPDSKSRKKTAPDKVEKSTAKPDAKTKSAKAEKPTAKLKSTANPDKEEKAVPKPDAETAQNNTEKADTKPEAAPEQNPAVPNPPAVMQQPNTSEVVGSPLKKIKQEFNERAKVIRQEMENIQNSFLVIGFQLHWIKTNKMYRILDYKSIYDYAEQEYGIKRSNCINLISIIEHFAERDENGEVIENIKDCYRNYSSSQLVAMLSMDEETRQQATPDMSVRAIQRLRKNEPEPKPTDEPDATVTNKKDTAIVQKSAQAESPTKVQEPATTASPPPASGNPASASIVPEVKATASKPTMEKKEIPKTAEQVNEESKASADNTAKESAKQEEPVPENSNTLLEIDSYSEYQKMTDKLDIMMKHVFSGEGDVRVKILCVHG